MNREIKFRFWITKAGKMSDWETAKKECDRLSLFEIDGFIPMQFINLKDKNRKEIYEGDIIKWDDRSNGKYWRVARVDINPDIQFVIIENTLHELSTFLPDVFHYGQFAYGGEDLEIVGNIYENPELLKQPT